MLRDVPKKSFHRFCAFATQIHAVVNANFHVSGVFRRLVRRLSRLELPISQKPKFLRRVGYTWIWQIQHYSDAIYFLLIVDRLVLKSSAYASAPCIQKAAIGDFDWNLQGIYDLDHAHESPKAV